MKKILALALAVMLLLSMAACGGAKQKNDGKYTIGICQFMPHDALDEATRGFMETVEKEFGKENITWMKKDAAGEASNCTSIISSFTSAKVDLIMANATPAVVAAANGTQVIPVLGTSVTEYGTALEIENFNGLVGGNVSGTSDLADLEKQAQMVIDWVPTAKKVGLLYCSAEANSKYQVNKVAEYLTGKGLECKMFGFADSSQMAAVTASAADWSDAIYVPTDNTVANNKDAINEICLPKKVPIITGEAATCAGCGIATLSISYYDLGVATGKMAIKILKGEAKISEMKIEYAPNATPLYNEEICKELGITPLEGYEKIG